MDSYAFVLMPFSTEFRDVYELGIKAACLDAGLSRCERVDEQMFHEDILTRIYRQIALADVVIADLTGRSANVFYETGYAHALGRFPILLTRNADDIPFDLKHYPQIVYGSSITDLKTKLTDKIKWVLSNPDALKDELETDNKKADKNADFLYLLGYFKSKNVNDPEVDLFLALGSGDESAANNAITRGAGGLTTDSEIIGRYKHLLIEDAEAFMRALRSDFISIR